MNKELESRLTEAPVVPLIQADDPSVAVEIANALVAGGLTVLEVVLRTEAAMKCLERVAADVPDAIVGAGTVLSVEHAKRSLDAGCRRSSTSSPQRTKARVTSRALCRGLARTPRASSPSSTAASFLSGLMPAPMAAVESDWTEAEALT